MYVYIYIYIYIYTHTHTHISKHTHTQFYKIDIMAKYQIRLYVQCPYTSPVMKINDCLYNN